MATLKTSDTKKIEKSYTMKIEVLATFHETIEKLSDGSHLVTLNVRHPNIASRTEVCVRVGEEHDPELALSYSRREIESAIIREISRQLSTGEK